MQIKLLGIDLAKNVFQLCALNRAGTVVFNRSVRHATALANQIRSLGSEYGVVFPNGIRALLARLPPGPGRRRQRAVAHCASGVGRDKPVLEMELLGLQGT